MKKAVIILGHGSRHPDADETVRRVAAQVRNINSNEIVAHAFLQYGKPGPEEVIDQCVKQGAEIVVIVPFFLQSGAHVAKDVPALLEMSRSRYPTLTFTATNPAGSHPLMADIVIDLIRNSS